MDSVITFGAKYLFLAVVGLWALAWVQSGRNHKKQISLATIIAVIVAGILDKIVSKLYYDPRPFVSHHIHPLIAHAADNGFPSEHTLFSMTLAATLIYYRPKLGWVAAAISLIVGICRIAAHVHSPIDIVGGTAIGFVAGYTGYYFACEFLPLKAKPGAGQPAGPTQKR